MIYKELNVKTVDQTIKIYFLHQSKPKLKVFFGKNLCLKSNSIVNNCLKDHYSFRNINIIFIFMKFDLKAHLNSIYYA